MNLQENISRIRSIILSEEMVQADGYKALQETIEILKKKNKVLLLSCSNRFNWDKNDIDIPKSKMLAMFIDDELGDKSKLIDVTELKIFPCEGNVSRKDGNSCGLIKSKLNKLFYRLDYIITIDSNGFIYFIDLQKQSDNFYDNNMSSGIELKRASSFSSTSRIKNT